MQIHNYQPQGNRGLLRRSSHTNSSRANSTITQFTYLDHLGRASLNGTSGRLRQYGGLPVLCIRSQETSDILKIEEISRLSCPKYRKSHDLRLEYFEVSDFNVNDMIKIRLYVEELLLGKACQVFAIGVPSGENLLIS